MKKILLLGIAAGVLLASCAAYAAPTLAGPTGNGVLPTAMVAPIDVINVAADYVNIEGDQQIAIRGQYGIGNMEIGAMCLTKSLENDWNVNVKYALAGTPIVGFSPALGAIYQVNDDVNTTEIYLVGTQAIASGEESPAINATLGVNWTKVDDESGVRGMIGVAMTMENNVTLSAEYQTKADDLESDPLFAVTARFPLSDMVSGQVGYSNGSIMGTDDSNFFAGVNISFNTQADLD